VTFVGLIAAEGIDLNGIEWGRGRLWEGRLLIRLERNDDVGSWGKLVEKGGEGREIEGEDWRGVKRGKIEGVEWKQREGSLRGIEGKRLGNLKYESGITLTSIFDFKVSQRESRATLKHFDNTCSFWNQKSLSKQSLGRIVRGDICRFTSINVPIFLLLW
jgi:hypothetical protein